MGEGLPDVQKFYFCFTVSSIRRYDFKSAFRKDDIQLLLQLKMYQNHFPGP
jgi:hypothetical protein